jgi:hypothetical protein
VFSDLVNAMQKAHCTQRNSTNHDRQFQGLSKRKDGANGARDNGAVRVLIPWLGDDLNQWCNAEAIADRKIVKPFNIQLRGIAKAERF